MTKPMAKPRPKNLNLLTIRLPCTAFVSILHRVTGVLIFLSLPLLLWVLQHSLASAESFAHLQTALATPLNKLGVWLILSALLYHVLAGIRHIVMDFGVSETLTGARFTAKLVLVLAAISMGGLGFLLW